MGIETRNSYFLKSSTNWEAIRLERPWDLKPYETKQNKCQAKPRVNSETRNQLEADPRQELSTLANKNSFCMCN